MSKDHAQILKDRMTCPSCSGSAESYFANGYVCPTCGRRESMFLKAFGIPELTQKDEDGLRQMINEGVAILKRVAQAIPLGESCPTPSPYWRNEMTEILLAAVCAIVAIIIAVAVPK